MAISKEALSYCSRGIVRYLNGDIKEFEKLVTQAMNFSEVEIKEQWTSCKYWHNGEKVKAKIDFRTGVIIDLKGNVLRKGMEA